MYNSATNLVGGIALADEPLANKPFDEYIDAYVAAPTPYGVAITFLRSAPKQAAPGTPPQREDIGSVRMSYEHLKIMVFLLRRLVKEVEQQTGTIYQLPVGLLNDLRVAPEDWEKFWKE